MPRPRRPILASACTAILMSTVGLWALSYLSMVECSWTRAENSHGIGAARQTTWQALCYNGGVTAFRETHTCFFAFAHPFTLRMSENVMPAGYPCVDADISDSTFKAVGFQWWTRRWIEQHSGDQYTQTDVVLPLWFPSLLTASGMLWFWRGSKPRTNRRMAFPVDPARPSSTPSPL